MTRRPGRRHEERGSAALEAVIGVPAFMVLLAMIIYGGRTAIAHQALESAAADAARSASIARTPQVASIDARQAAIDNLSAQQIHCRNITVHVDTADVTKAPGIPGAVRVTISCRLDLGDLAVPGLPGSRVLTATMRSPIDTWRSVS